MGIFDEIKLSYKNGSYLIRIIYINIAVWLAVRIIAVIYSLSGMEEFPLLNWLSLPASFDQFIYRPWSILTYMFLHFDLLHILFNVLWLYWFGKIFLEYHTPGKLLSLYILGGILGGVAFVTAYHFFPLFENKIGFTQLLGASASVIAIVIATAVYVPNHLIHFMFIGPVKIKWIALFSIFLYIINLDGENAGGNFSHLGGALWGFIYMSQLKAGRDITAGFNRFIDNLFHPSSRSKRKLKVEFKSERDRDYNFNLTKKEQQEEINRILDKISRSGYDTLTTEEKEMLFKMSKK